MQNPIDFKVADIYPFTSSFDESNRLGKLGSFDTMCRGLFPANNTHNLQEQYVELRCHTALFYVVSQYILYIYIYIYTRPTLDILGLKARTKMGPFLYLCIN